MKQHIHTQTYTLWCVKAAENRGAENPVKPPPPATAGLLNGNAILSLATVKTPHHNALLIFSATVSSAGGLTHTQIPSQRDG